MATSCPHTDRPHYSGGMCQSCYLAKYYLKRKQKNQDKAKGKQEPKQEEEQDKVEKQTEETTKGSIDQPQKVSSTNLASLNAGKSRLRCKRNGKNNTIRGTIEGEPHLNKRQNTQ